QGGNRPEVRIEDVQSLEPWALTGPYALQRDRVIDDHALRVVAIADEDRIGAGVDAEPNRGECVGDDDAAREDRIDPEGTAENQRGYAANKQPRQEKPRGNNAARGLIAPYSTRGLHEASG